MENKLQELTRKLYDEGLEKGRAEAERLVADAKTRAAKIEADARAQAENVLRQAQAKAEDVEKNTLTEIALAGKQAVARIKSEIAGMIVAKSIDAGVKEAAIDPAFIKEMLLAVAKNWNGADAGKVELQALLPESERAKLDEAFGKVAKELLAAGIEVGYSKEVRTGFKVDAKDGGYYISFSDADIEALLGEYLREKVSRMLFKA
jgi:V/A-type H+-transporting ATPase subunit E